MSWKCFTVGMRVRVAESRSCTRGCWGTVAKVCDNGIVGVDLDDSPTDKARWYYSELELAELEEDE